MKRHRDNGVHLAGKVALETDREPLGHRAGEDGGAAVLQSAHRLARAAAVVVEDQMSVDIETGGSVDIPKVGKTGVTNRRVVK